MPRARRRRPARGPQYLIAGGATPDEARREVAEIQAAHREIKSRPCGRAWACYRTRQAALEVNLRWQLGDRVVAGDGCGGWHIEGSGSPR